MFHIQNMLAVFLMPSQNVDRFNLQQSINSACEMKSNRCKRTDKPNSTENRIHIGKYDRNAREIRANIIVNAIFCCSCAIMEFPTAFIFHWRISFTLLHHINGAIHLNSLNLTDRVRNICRNHSQRVTLALSIIQFRKLFCNFNANEIQLDLSN